MAKVTFTDPRFTRRELGLMFTMFCKLLDDIKLEVDGPSNFLSALDITQEQFRCEMFRQYLSEHGQDWLREVEEAEK